MGDPEKVKSVLENLGIRFTEYRHPPSPTIEIASEYWKDIPSQHCKNLFFRNHKGNRHYLVILDARQALDIHDLEKRLKQGKISFASDQRLEKYLGLQAGSVSPFGLINDIANHVHVFLDENLRTADFISFHPNLNTHTLVISYADFEKYLNWTGNSYEYLKLYD
ncbi:MAG: prolyl-tRNA synthetase associated domain-containing protein [Bacteroidales bacterium]|nr:prolyl-tRNA synthetase associated domain-containing protein [Bacteroidales bacterium]MCB8998700.1 prolyl-tRNA synthetase associated domain-containing protein [Bacteroidales bacterium]